MAIFCMMRGPDTNTNWKHARPRHMCPKCRGYLFLDQCTNCSYRIGDKPNDEEWLSIITPWSWRTDAISSCYSKQNCFQYHHKYLKCRSSLLQSTDRCSKCGVLIDKSWMRNARRCFIDAKSKKKFVKQLILTEAILIAAVALLYVL